MQLEFHQSLRKLKNLVNAHLTSINIAKDQFAKMAGNTVLTLIAASNSSSLIKAFHGQMQGQNAEI